MYPAGSAMGQGVCAEFPGLGMREICWPGRNAAVTKQLGWASQWRCCMPVLPGDTHVTADTLCCVMPALPRVFDVACPLCSGVCQAVPLLPLGMFICSGHICLTSVGQGPAQLPAGVPVCHACVTAAPPCHQRAWLCATNSSQQPPYVEAPHPRPLVHCPTPAVSRDTLNFQRQLCHENIFTVCCWGAVCPQEHSGGIRCPWQSQRRSEKRQGCTAWHHTRHPGVRIVQAHPVGHRALPGPPSSTAALGSGVCVPLSPGGRCREAGQFLEPTSLPLAAVTVTVLLVPRPQCPPPALPPAAAAPAGGALAFLGYF